LDLQSNTWHNLTYAYQGEGGSKVTYLDGRKVAEDQAEDTFGEYPPFAMTGYSQGGYVVSASNSVSASFPAWYVFDDTNSGWEAYPGRYNQSSPYTHTGGVTTVTNVTSRLGDYIQLDFPYKIQINYFDFTAQNYSFHRSPYTGVLIGSNDEGVTWTEVKLFDVTVDGSPTSYSASGITTFSGFNPGFYKSFRLIWLTVGTGSTNDRAACQELKLYGHRENDLVRLPDPTNVLKYPHIAMTGPAQRGYVVSASNDSPSNGRDAWRAFNNSTSDAWSTGYTNGYSGTTPFGATANAPLFEGVRGDYIKLELPHKLTVSQIEQNGSTVRRAAQANLYGSNNDTDWVLIKENFTVPNTNPAKADINATEGYKYLVFQVLNLTGSDSSTNALIFIYYINFYGTGVDSIPIQIGGGNIDKVANFRVYDKFVGEDQALEIWDAQKDYFGRAKSQMVLQQGKLGVGTDAPQGRFSVADEPHNLEEFPPRAMTGYKNYFEGHGEFCVRASSEGTTHQIWKAFNKVSSSGDWWEDSNYPSYTNAVYNGAGSYSLGGISGQYVIFELPYKIDLKSITIAPRTDLGGRSPGTGVILGSNDRTNWEQIHSFSGLTYTNDTFTNININTTKKYSMFAMVVTNISGSEANTGLQLSEMKLFGTREQGQSVLHDGQLTLTKNLNVPRIGPPLDADDTPRRDRLVVEYNTSTNPTFEGAVRDTSGRGLDGMFYGGASYDASQKALGFDGVDDYVQVRINNTGGDYIHSVSWWFKTDITTAAIGTNEDSMWSLGDTWSARVCSYSSFYNDRMYFAWNTYNINCATTNIKQLQWNHACVTYTGGGSSLTSRKIYINGIVQTSTLDNAAGTLLNLPANTLLTLGNTQGRSTFLDGSLSQFKLYDTALTAEEVKTLYDMGRCDEGHHVVNFSKTRVGIGLGDGEAPQAALDVRGVASFESVGIGTMSPETPLHITRLADHGELLTIEGKTTSGDDEISGGIRFKHDTGHGDGHRGITWYNTNQNFLMGGVTMSVGGSYNTCKVGFHAAVSRSGGDTLRAYITSGGTLTTFTGQHRCFIKDVPFTEAKEREGLIVSTINNDYIKLNEGVVRGLNAITINESVPLVSVSNVMNDKKCFGVISASEDPEERSDAYGNLVNVFEKEKGDTRVYINSVGEGAIWVSNIGGNLEAGDYITTSNVAGYGQKQDSEFLANYTVAKITMDCDFEPVTQPIQQIIRSNVVQTYYIGNVHKTKSVPYEFVTTTVGADDVWSNVSVSPSDVTYAEWSNLEANTQNTYNLTYSQTSNVVYDTKYTLTTTANVTESDPWDSVFVDPSDVTYAEYSNLEANTQSTYSLTFTQTITDKKTPAVWSNLESNTQSLYTEVYYQSVEEEVASEYPGATTHTRVTDVIENVLDEHGQIQWEDHATETEKAYKIRYLDANGVITDEANAVHTAAFVGCTYHCG